VVAAHLNCLVTLVRLTSVLHQHPSLYRLLLLLPLLVALLLLVAMRDAITIGVWSDDVVVQQLTFGEELATICVVPRAP